MYVNTHAEARIRRRLNGSAAAVLARLESMPGTPDDVAIEVHRFPAPVADDTGSNGDSVVVVARAGEVCTVMLRRSWNQPFTPSALDVDRVERWRQ